MKRLLLLRHAKSSWSEEGLADHERPLSRRGMRDATAMAELFADGKLPIDMVLCSSAKRARQTYAQVAKKLSSAPKVHVEHALYLPSHDSLLATLKAVPDQVGSVLVVGHSPSLDALALSLLGDQQASERSRIAEKLPTGALCVFELDVRSFRKVQRKHASLRTFVTPRELGAHDTSVPLEPHKAERVELDKHATLHEAAQRVVGACVAQIRTNAAGARQGENPEFIHQMRVGVRRLRVALRLFKEALEVNVATRLQKQLRWLFRQLGPVREYDVFLKDVVEPLVKRNKSSTLHTLCTVLADERKALLDHARRSIDSPQYVDLIRELAMLEASLGGSSQRTKPLAHWASRYLDRRLANVVALHSALVQQQDALALHELRKELKKLRYGAEFVRGAFSAKRSKLYLKRVAKLQDVLGALTDVAVAERLLRQALHQLPDARARSRVRAEVRGVLDATSVREGLGLTEALSALIETKPFWH